MKNNVIAVSGAEVVEYDDLEETTEAVISTYLIRIIFFCDTIIY